ncbi:hypothetical protein FB45DRAFT_1052427 [Roridomyces roridus]|uniref:F-box domain-containing protein n=1 Tax=Roridomyces roridus TaxID=1738132 RepID=A0AAD7CGI8_9AGAR|nr:hypothetical protein FB45DRAFT_1052427 [Roridomyces roridus]
MSYSDALSLCECCSASFSHSPLLEKADELCRNMLDSIHSNQLSQYRRLPQLHEIIQHAPAELDRYDLVLESLDAKLEELFAARSTLSRLLDLAKGVVHGPAMQLPNEIVAMVFGHCLVDKEWDLEPITPETWEREAKAEVARVMGGGLRSLSQVCQQWREVALGTAALWSTINLDLRCWSLPMETSGAYLLHEVMMDKLGLALQHTRYNLLTVNVHGVGQCRLEALATVAAHSHRWHSATITVDTSMLTTLAPIAGNLHFLQNVTIQGLSEAEDAMMETMEYFSAAPLLRRVGFCGPAEAVARVPLEQLEFLSHSGVTGEDLLHIFSQMQRVPTGCALHMELNFEGIAEELELDGLEFFPVISPIAELKLYSEEHDGPETEAVLDAMFSSLKLPQLQRLGIFGTPSDEESLKPLLWPHRSGLTLLEGAGRNLRLLDIPDVRLSQRELLDVLAVVPALEHLLISDQLPEHHLITDTLLEALSLTVSSFTPALIPNLSTLILRSLQGFTVPALLELLTVRTAAASDDFECRLAWFPQRRFSSMSLDCIVNLRESFGERGGPGLLWSCGEFDREGC